jgi:hypothetical protein
MDLEDQYRFDVEAEPARDDIANLTLACDRCTWMAYLDNPLSLRDLNERAQEHAEVCR